MIVNGMSWNRDMDDYSCGTPQRSVNNLSCLCMTWNPGRHGLFSKGNLSKEKLKVICYSGKLLP